MKKLLLIGVTYHSDDVLHVFLESVHRAAEQTKGKLQVDIEIADNDKDNRGYLGGALPIYNAKAQGYDFVAISNVDLKLAPDFFEQLLLTPTDQIGWIAPDIHTDKINRHENPYMMVRPTRLNFLIWNTIYSSTLCYRLYHHLHLLKSKQIQQHPACSIYAGHGSFMLFTKAFVQHYPELHFPTFMYGEEIWFAELVRAAHLQVNYAPNLRIANIGNISTGLIRQKQKSAWSKESLNMIKQTFFDK